MRIGVMYEVFIRWMLMVGLGAGGLQVAPQRPVSEIERSGEYLPDGASIYPPYLFR